MITRKISGWATTEDIDKVGDVVVADGVRFEKMPLPLLGGHDHKQAIGTVTSAKVVKGVGVMIEATLFPKGESQIADHWAATAKYGACAAFSIGFRGAGRSNAHGGTTYSSATVSEVSLVAVPCNSKCVAKYSESGAATTAKPTQPARVKPQANKPMPNATQATKARKQALVNEHNEKQAARAKRIAALTSK